MQYCNLNSIAHKFKHQRHWKSFTYLYISPSVFRSTNYWKSPTKSKRTRSFTELYFTPLRSWSGIARIPLLNSDTGRHVWPPKSSFSDMSYSWTSICSKANSGTVNGNSNSLFNAAIQLSSRVFVLFIVVSTGTPAIPIFT